MNSFSHKEYLWVLLFMPVLIYWFVSYSRWRKKVRSRIAAEKLSNHYLPVGDERKQRIRQYLITMAYICLILALADPTLFKKSTPEEVKGRDLVVLLDVSKSMLAEDVKPSRLEAGKELVRRLIRKFPEERFGLMLFAGRPYFSMPLTYDAAAMDLFLETASPLTVPSQGSSLGEAIRVSTEAFLIQEKRQPILLLITDGEDHTNEALKSVGMLKEKGINLLLVGCGSETGATIPEPGTEEPKKDKDGNIIYSKMNAGFLQELAEKGSGRFIKMNDVGSAVKQAEDQIEKLEKTGGIQKMDDLQQQHSFTLFMLAALLLLLPGGWIYFPFKQKTILSTLCLLFAASIITRAQSDVFEKGAYYYQRSDFGKAAAFYQKGISQGKDARLYYNLGNCFFRLGKTKEALQQFDFGWKYTKDLSLQSSCLYNKGVILHQTGRLEEAVENYKKALLLTPDDASVRKNLQLGLTQLHARQNRSSLPPERRTTNTLNLQELRTQEMELQKRIQKKNSRPDISDKDW